MAYTVCIPWEQIHIIEYRSEKILKLSFFSTAGVTKKAVFSRRIGEVVFFWPIKKIIMSAG